MSILDDLNAIKERYNKLCGYELRTLELSGRQLIEAYRCGALVPNDTSINIMIPDCDWQMVQDFLKTFKGFEG